MSTEQRQGLLDWRQRGGRWILLGQMDLVLTWVSLRPNMNPSRVGGSLWEPQFHWKLLGRRQEWQGTVLTFHHWTQWLGVIGDRWSSFHFPTKPDSLKFRKIKLHVPVRFPEFQFRMFRMIPVPGRMALEFACFI